jgi:hypothetical protein
MPYPREEVKFFLLVTFMTVVLGIFCNSNLLKVKKFATFFADKQIVVTRIIHEEPFFLQQFVYPPIFLGLEVQLDFLDTP